MKQLIDYILNHAVQMILLSALVGVIGGMIYVQVCDFIAAHLA